MYGAMRLQMHGRFTDEAHLLPVAVEHPLPKYLARGAGPRVRLQWTLAGLGRWICVRGAIRLGCARPPGQCVHTTQGT